MDTTYDAERGREDLERATGLATTARERALEQLEEAIAGREAALRTRARMEAQRDEAIAARAEAESRRDEVLVQRDEARRNATRCCSPTVRCSASSRAAGRSRSAGSPRRRQPTPSNPGLQQYRHSPPRRLPRRPSAAPSSRSACA